MQGDWTLVGALRHALRDAVCFVEVTYPRTTVWELEEYAAAVESGLRDAGLSGGWILAESFGSQVAWPFCSRARGFRVDGLILAGGFGRHPMPPMVDMTARVMGRLPFGFLRGSLALYERVSRWRFRRSPTVREELREFMERRTPADRDALVHRLELILRNRPETLARRVTAPVYYLAGLFDPVVPWPWVPSWLRRHCPGFRGWRLLAGADHNVLSSGAEKAARTIVGWMEGRNVEALRREDSKG